MTSEQCDTTGETTTATGPRTLREMRSTAQWSQAQLADRAGISKALVSALENGQAPSPGLNTLEGLARAFGVELMVIIEALRASVAEASV